MYGLYGSTPSLFTRKLEAALIFYRAPFEFISKPSHPDPKGLEARVGTHQVPVLQTPEDWVIADTTPIIEMLDHRFPQRRLFPPGPLGVIAHLVEECLDEWVARVMVHYRWHYPDSAAFASEVIADGDPVRAEFIRGWGPRACRATGTETAFHQQAAEAEYIRLLAAAEAQLGETRYLMGDRPTPADCMFLGGLRAHTLHDPDPRKVVEAYPRVVAWSTTADAWDGGGDWASFPQSTAFARHVLGELASSYLPVLRGHRAAAAAGLKAFTVETHGQPASYLTRAYPIQSWSQIQARLDRLEPRDREAVAGWLTDQGLAGDLGPEA
ncbi:glutathione S-transferase family protein [Phenylobacterium sp.]|jgi:glutathione S-transferase|uniref:glutathione S-transferase family protein n=1 Tax=Phenylobacterium sp. TaxID=1871053 RepID=UPI0037CBCDFE